MTKRIFKVFILATAAVVCLHFLYPICICLLEPVFVIWGCVIVESPAASISCTHCYYQRSEEASIVLTKAICYLKINPLRLTLLARLAMLRIRQLLDPSPSTRIWYETTSVGETSVLEIWGSVEIRLKIIYIKLEYLNPHKCVQTNDYYRIELLMFGIFEII